MNIRMALVASTCALACLASNGFAQTTPPEKAQAAIGTYISIIAVSKVCDFTPTKEVIDAISGNMKALQPISGLDDTAIGGGIERGVTKLTATKADVCAMGRQGFDGYLVAQAAKAAEIASGSGVTLAPVPAGTPADPKEEAKEMLILAYLLEAVAEECDDIELTDAETAKLDKAQTFFRAKAGYTEAETTGLSDAMEKEAAKGKKEFCSPAFEFKSKLKSVFDAAK